MTPTIIALQNRDDRLIATLDDKTETEIVTFRETLWRQGKIMLQPPLDARCQPFQINCDFTNEDSDLIVVDGCIHDLWAAGIVGEFVAGEMPNGTQKRK